MLLAAQYTTAHLRPAAGGQVWAAVHPVSAVLLFWIATELARRSHRLTRCGRSASASASFGGLGSSMCDWKVASECSKDQPGGAPRVAATTSHSARATCHRDSTFNRARICSA